METTELDIARGPTRTLPSVLFYVFVDRTSLLFLFENIVDNETLFFSYFTMKAWLPTYYSHII